MKYTVRLFAASLVAFFLGYMAFNYVVVAIYHSPYDVYQSVTVGFLAGLIYALAVSIGTYKKISPRLAYLATPEPYEPKLDGMEYELISFKGKQLEFEQLLSFVQQQYVVTYSNASAGVVKLHQPIKLDRWGVGAFISLDTELHQLKVITFAMKEMNKKTRRQANELMESFRQLARSL